MCIPSSNKSLSSVVTFNNQLRSSLVSPCVLYLPTSAMSCCITVVFSYCTSAGLWQRLSVWWKQCRFTTPTLDCGCGLQSAASLLTRGYDLTDDADLSFDLLFVVCLFLFSFFFTFYFIRFFFKPISNISCCLVKEYNNNKIDFWKVKYYLILIIIMMNLLQ